MNETKNALKRMPFNLLPYSLQIYGHILRFFPNQNLDMDRGHLKFSDELDLLCNK